MGNQKSHNDNTKEEDQNSVNDQPIIDPIIVKHHAKQLALDEALVEAVNNNNCVTAKTLMDAGANPELVLYGAAIMKELDIFKMLYQHTPDPNNANLLKVVLNRIHDSIYTNKVFDTDKLLQKIGLQYSTYDIDQQVERLLTICEYIISQNENIFNKFNCKGYRILLQGAHKHNKSDLLKICIKYCLTTGREDFLEITTEYNPQGIIKYLTDEPNIWENSNFPIKGVLKLATKQNNEEIMGMCLKRL